MPLLPGKENVGHNISEMIHAGHPRDQAIAASLKKAGLSNKYTDGDGQPSQAIPLKEQTGNLPTTYSLKLPYKFVPKSK